MGKNKEFRHLIETQWCKGCGICVYFCPKQVLELDNTGKVAAVRPGDCIGCKQCELRCPDLAIQIIKLQGGKAQEEEQ